MEEGKQLGFRKYELRCLDDYEHRVPYFKPGRKEDLLAAVGSGEMEITAVTPGLFKGGLQDVETVKRELLEALPDTCEISRELGADIIIVFSFKREDESDEPEALALLMEAAKTVESFGLKMAIENEPGMFCDTGVTTARILDKINQPHVGINWDPGNSCSAGEIAYPVGYEAVRSRMINCHIKDTIPLPPEKWENRLVGDGGVNWLGQLHALIRDGDLSHLTLETHVFPLLQATREDVRRLRLLMDWIPAFFPDEDPLA